jgi:hypothetical protein
VTKKGDKRRLQGVLRVLALKIRARPCFLQSPIGFITNIVFPRLVPEVTKAQRARSRKDPVVKAIAGFER